VGGLATPVGTPPNLIGLGIIEQQLGIKISFFHWMAFGLPLALVLIAFLVAYLNRLCTAEAGLMSGGARWSQEEKSGLGPLTAGERNVLSAFLATVTLWVLPGHRYRNRNDAPACQWMNRHPPEAMISPLARPPLRAADGSALGNVHSPGAKPPASTGVHPFAAHWSAI
jgi:sodium-dependent dicarboxylate transporter 2/3/5